MILLFPPGRIPGGKHISSILAYSSYGVYTFEKNHALCRDRAKKTACESRAKAVWQENKKPSRKPAEMQVRKGSESR